MSHFLKPTKSKVKLFLFFIFIIFIFSLLAVFPTNIIIRRAGIEHFQEQINIFNKFFGIFRSLFIPYIIVVFLKKEFFIKKYFTEFAKIFFIVFIFEKLVGIIPIILYKSLSDDIFLSDPIQYAGFGLQLIIYYIAVCFIDKVVKYNAKPIKAKIKT